MRSMRPGFPTSRFVSVRGSIQIWSEIESLASRTPSAALQLRSAQNDIMRWALKERATDLNSRVRTPVAASSYVSDRRAASRRMVRRSAAVASRRDAPRVPKDGEQLYACYVWLFEFVGAIHALGPCANAAQHSVLPWTLLRLGHRASDSFNLCN